MIDPIPTTPRTGTGVPSPQRLTGTRQIWLGVGPHRVANILPLARHSRASHPRCCVQLVPYPAAHLGAVPQRAAGCSALLA